MNVVPARSVSGDYFVFTTTPPEKPIAAWGGRWLTIVSGFDGLVAMLTSLQDPNLVVLPIQAEGSVLRDAIESLDKLFAPAEGFARWEAWDAATGRFYFPDLEDLHFVSSDDVLYAGIGVTSTGIWLVDSVGAPLRGSANGSPLPSPRSAEEALRFYAHHLFHEAVLQIEIPELEAWFDLGGDRAFSREHLAPADPGPPQQVVDWMREIEVELPESPWVLWAGNMIRRGEPDRRGFPTWWPQQRVARRGFTPEQLEEAREWLVSRPSAPSWAAEAVIVRRPRSEFVAYFYEQVGIDLSAPSSVPPETP